MSAFITSKTIIASSFLTHRRELEAYNSCCRSSSNECRLQNKIVLQKATSFLQSHIWKCSKRERKQTKAWSTDGRTSAFNQPPTASLSKGSLASQIVSFLRKREINILFGVIGRYVAPFFEVLRRQHDMILIQSREESNAVFSAIGYYNVTRTIAVVVVTAGPGLTNSITALSTAHLTNTPVLVIAGETPNGESLQGQSLTTEGLHAEAMLSPVARAVVRIAGVSTALGQVSKALNIAIHPSRPGPVVLVVPVDLSFQNAAFYEPAYSSPLLQTLAPIEAIQTAARWLAEARHPLLVIGAECRNCPAKVEELIHTLGVPFVATPAAKGIFDERHPLCLRNSGFGASAWIKRYSSIGIDVALVIGTSLHEFETRETPYTSSNGFLIHVDLDPGVFNRNVPTALGIVSSAETFCRQLQDTFVKGPGFDDRIKTLMKTITSIPPYFEGETSTNDLHHVAPHLAILSLEKGFPSNAFVVSDIGEHALFALHYLTIGKSQDFRVELCFGAMGSGISQSIGIALGEPERQVFCICGDGCMEMAGMEVLTAVKHALRIVFVVFNDSSYNMVHHGMKTQFGSAEDFESPLVDFATWGHAMGLRAWKITSLSQLSEEFIQSLLFVDGPALLDVRTLRHCLLGTDRAGTLRGTGSTGMTP